MKGRLIVSSWLTKLFSAGKADAITIFPFIFLKKTIQKEDKILINHERIHLIQALELLVIPFYVWYIIEFFIRFIYFRNFNRAYLNISFEKEAYSNQYNDKYLKQRKLWGFWRYL